MAALVGGFLARAVFGTPTQSQEVSSPDTRSGLRFGAPGGCCRRSSCCRAAGLIAAAALATAKLEPGLWAGLCYLLTWWLIGLTALGALLARGRRREFWLGASFFGAGFMILVFARPHYDPHDPETFIPTIRFLEVVRPRLERLMSRFDAEKASTATLNVKIQEALDRPMPMPLAKPISLEAVVNYIKDATRSPNGEAIPIYVDPIGLAESDHQMSSTISQVDLEGVPLRSSLRLCLRQLQLDYFVRDGVLLITSVESLSDRVRN